MNIIELQERLKDLPENALMQEMQMPSGTAPQFLVLSELKRRKRMRDEYQRQQAQGMQTVAEEAVTAAGAPAEGIMQMSRAMAPQSAIAQNTGVNDMMQQQSVRAPQPEQPMMMADGGYVRKMRDGGFGENVEYDYVAFLQEMGLNDTPDARDAFRRYQERMNAQYALEGPNTDPSLFTPGIDRPPQAMALPDVSTDVGAFLPDASARQPLFDIPRLDVPPMSRDVPPMTSMPPALMSGSADTIDFDASVTAVPAAPPPREPESYLDTMLRITREAADTARGMGIPIPESQPGINIDDIVRESDGVYTDALRDYLSGFRGDRGLSRPFEADPLDPRSPGFMPPEEEAPRVSPGRGGTRPVVGAPSFYDLLASPGSGGDPRSRRSRGMDEEVAEEAETETEFDRLARESAAEAAALRERLGITDASGSIGAAIARGDDEEAARLAEEARQAVRRSSELDGLSFGLGPVDVPTTDTELSFGSITPSAADIPLSTGREPTGGAISDLPIGQPATVPEAEAVASRGGETGGGAGGGAGGYGAIESRIARMLEERERSAQADKWLSLAQTGLALMASNQPTIGGAIGEAGLAGIGALQKARSQYDKDIMELLDMQAGVQRARAAGARTREPKARTPAELKGALEVFESEVERLAKPIYGPDPSDLTGMKQTIVGYDYSSVPPDVMNNYTRLRDQYLQMFQSPVDVTS